MGRDSEEEEALKLMRNQETRRDEGWKGETVATRVGGTGSLALLENKKQRLEGGGGGYVQEKCTEGSSSNSGMQPTETPLKIRDYTRSRSHSRFHS